MGGGKVEIVSLNDDNIMTLNEADAAACRAWMMEENCTMRTPTAADPAVSTMRSSYVADATSNFDDEMAVVNANFAALSSRQIGFPRAGLISSCRPEVVHILT